MRERYSRFMPIAGDPCDYHPILRYFLSKVRLQPCPCRRNYRISETRSRSGQPICATPHADRDQVYGERRGDAGYRAIETLTGWADLGSAEYKRNPRYVWRYLLEEFKPLPGCFVLKGSEFGDIGTSTCEA